MGDKGIWVGLFEALAQSGGPALQLMIDSSAVKAHRSAAGGNSHLVKSRICRRPRRSWNIRERSELR
jgi:hypothetical protein